MTLTSNHQEIARRFDVVKDHKKRAPKKLGELGEILASAYLVDHGWADDMWRYLFDLNVSEDETKGKYYVTQVYKKICEHLSRKDAALFLAMDCRRLRILALHGYVSISFLGFLK